jgi:hypothetical protein
MILEVRDPFGGTHFYTNKWIAMLKCCGKQFATLQGLRVHITTMHHRAFAREKVRSERRASLPPLPAAPRGISLLSDGRYQVRTPRCLLTEQSVKVAHFRNLEDAMCYKEQLMEVKGVVRRRRDSM